MSTSTGGPRSGRRPGVSGTKEAILEAARHRFAERGYDRTSLRAIAADAGVDQALIAHFFGSKMQLFVGVVEVPIAPEVIVSRILGGGPEDIGERAARTVVTLLGDAGLRGRMIGLLRATTSEPEAARMVRDLLTRRIWAPLAESLGVEDADLRVNLVASQIVGIVMVRYILEAEPLASLSEDHLVDLIAPTLQRYLTGQL